MKCVLNIVATATVIASILLSAPNGYASSLHTNVERTDTSTNQWFTEVSRASLDQLAKRFRSDHNVLEMLQNIEIGLSSTTHVNVKSAGFYSGMADNSMSCRVFPITRVAGPRRVIRYNETVTIIPGDVQSTCDRRAWDLHTAVYSYLAGEDQLARSRRLETFGTKALGLVAHTEKGSFSSFRSLTPLEVVKHGYTIREKDTLSWIAQEATGKSSDWRKLRIVRPGKEDEAFDPNNIFPSDKVFFPKKIAQEYARNVAPGRYYEEELALSILTDSGEYADLGDHLNRGGAGGEIWIPDEVVEWKRFARGDVPRDPYRISSEVYGSNNYGTVVSILCKRMLTMAETDFCILPIFRPALGGEKLRLFREIYSK